MSATLELTHKSIGAEVRRDPYDVVVDGEQVGSVEMNATLKTPVEPGLHTLQVRNGRKSSRTETFDAAEGEVIAFRCTGKRFLPIFLASFIAPKLALKLVRGLEPMAPGFAFGQSCLPTLGVDSSTKPPDLLNRPGFHRDSVVWGTAPAAARLTVVVGLELCRRDLADLVVDAAVVEPVDVGERGPLDVLDALPGAFVVDELGLVEPVEGSRPGHCRRSRRGCRRC